jgi:hypothetical protein
MEQALTSPMIVTARGPHQKTRAPPSRKRRTAGAPLRQTIETALLQSRMIQTLGAMMRRNRGKALLPYQPIEPEALKCRSREKTPHLFLMMQTARVQTRQNWREPLSLSPTKQEKGASSRQNQRKSPLLFQKTQAGAPMFRSQEKTPLLFQPTQKTEALMRRSLRKLLPPSQLSPRAREHLLRTQGTPQPHFRGRRRPEEPIDLPR